MTTVEARHWETKPAPLAAVSGEMVAARIEQSGWFCVDDVVTTDWIAQALGEALRHVGPGDYEVILDDLEATPTSVGHRIAHDSAIRALLESVTRATAPWLDTSEHALRTSLRVIVGEDPRTRTPNFHYDRSAVTMVIPIQMPDGPAGTSGELIMAPSHRPFRKFATLNVIEKAVVQSQRFRRWFVEHLPARTVVLPMEVGNAYLFWGYRSYHTTLPCPSNGVRVTLIVHFGEVHDGSRVLELSKTRSRSWRLRRDSTIRVHAG
jgi:hypothetical protein